MERPECLEEALAIADRIWARRLRGPEGAPTWIGPVGYGTDLTPLKEVRLGSQLYNGTTGIALLFAALGRVDGGREHRDAALWILAPLRRKLAELTADPDRADRLQTPIGGLIGLGSFLYGLLKVGEFLDDPSLIREAHAATALITPERIASDGQVRIQTGCAGTILVLLSLHAKLPQANVLGKTPLDIACECARHLLDARISFEGRPLAWALSPGKPPLAGFSYGAAGICYALLRLHGMTGRQDLRDAAHEGLAFVRELYAPEHGGWHDIRLIFQAHYRPRAGTWKDWWAFGSLKDLEEVPDPPAVNDIFPWMWCHGSAGIGLGRIAAIPENDSPEARQEIDGVLKRVKSYARDAEVLDGPDDLCCGHMGLVEFLLCASRKLGDENAWETALCLIDRVRQRARARGEYELSASRGANLFAPYLFQGIAGVGYSLLRMAAPDAIPCVLLLE